MLSRSMVPRSWFPSGARRPDGLLRRHVPANLAAFRRWYADPDVARLTRYQDGPMRADEVERFFQVRVVGPSSLAMAIHVRESGRLIGTCAFSQLDGDNGSALFHITIGEKDIWSHGYGTEATGLMLDHAFGVLGLHRIALAVFAFNERAIRAYEKVGFSIEGRSRESIWRDGRWWDELHMSVLAREWAVRPRGCRRRRTASWPTPAPTARRGARRDRRDDRRWQAPDLKPRRARAAFRELMDAKGHAVTNAREAVAGLEAAFDAGVLVRTPALDQELADLMVALEADDDGKVGGKSAEAARFILRAISRSLDDA